VQKWRQAEVRHPGLGKRTRLPMKHLAGLFLTVAVATTGCVAAWPYSPITEPTEAWIESSPRDASDAARFAMERRLSQVAYRIGVGNADLCAGANTRFLGLVLTLSDSALGYDADPSSEPLTISWLIPGAPAAGSGLREGDHILDIDGEPLSFEPQALNRLTDRLRGHGNDVVSLGIERAGSRSQVAVNPVPACDYQVELSASEDVNAFAEERHVVVTEGMLTLLSHDDQLALVVGHELGHISAGHTTGGVDPGMGTNMEAEADYLGIYFAARAGYDISGAKDVLRRIVAVRHGGFVDAEYIGQRFRAIEAALAEINAKRNLGKNLHPSSDRLVHYPWD
jgi:membrane-associated protease RseP (regulator of RpoE activity)